MRFKKFIKVNNGRYRARKVTLNKPRRIGKGEPSYGKKKSVVYVMDKGKVKKVTFGDPNDENKKESAKTQEQF